MNKSNKYSPEVRERAVRMVQEYRNEYPSQWVAIESIAPKIGCVPQTLHDWVKKHEIDTGLRDGITSEERDRIKVLEREVKVHCFGSSSVVMQHGICAYLKSVHWCRLKLRTG